MDCGRPIKFHAQTRYAETDKRCCLSRAELDKLIMLFVRVNLLMPCVPLCMTCIINYIYEQLLVNVSKFYRTVIIDAVTDMSA